MEDLKTTHTNHHNHSHNQEHHHEHGHAHEHHHGGKMTVVLFFVGLVMFLVGLFFHQNNGVIANVLFTGTILFSGFHIIIEGLGDTVRDSIEAKRFRPNLHLLMTLATLGAVAIGNFEEGALLILIFAAAHFLEEYVDGKSKREITNLLNMNPTEARLILADDTVKVISVDDVKVGARLQVLNGDQVPTDGVILSGRTAIDESSINGESMPKEKNVGDEVFGSTINGSGTFTMEVTKDSSETVFAKILQLVNQSQGNLSKTATFIKRMEPIYVTIALLLFPLVVLSGPYLLGWSWDLSWYRGMVFLISVSPCALAASAVPTTLSTISNLAKKGVLVKGGAFLSTLAGVKAFAFDKTGTLTNGKPVVTDYSFEDNQELIDIVVSMEKQTNHPLATAIIAKFPTSNVLDLTVENEVGKGLSAVYQGHNYRIGKPSSFMQVPEALKAEERQLAQEGKTVVFVAKDEVVVGLLALMDVPNKDAKQAIQYFQQVGIHTTMITGDAQLTGEAVAKQLGIDEVVANVMPEDKAKIAKEQQEAYGTVGMVGDGINDAPALVTSDVGIAMGDGTDVAIDVADVVLMKNDLSKLVYAHQLAKKMDRVIWQNLIFAMFVVLVLVVLNFLGKSSIALGVILHEGSTIVVILNGLRLLLTPKKFLA
ncbi:heavy metal translocating P-type ATPase [Candidatus Enterococcus willemsii]|uniref:Metal-transporting ATPase n=1 Tax=Candidatus Enterococcus willemsii TaxID=1857215 RepID=A0ABQ6YVC6_9ENTE|nr:heavy metal translocating P-type ATPase [Enterococcus sp. CU12B]KAF1301039.1 metal-transporting ATPase [Enterococcus sp. CU12B]